VIRKKLRFTPNKASLLKLHSRPILIVFSDFVGIGPIRKIGIRLSNDEFPVPIAVLPRRSDLIVVEPQFERVAHRQTRPENPTEPAFLNAFCLRL
jgi:hypothetical protein